MTTTEVEHWIMNRLTGNFDFPLFARKDPSPVAIFSEIVDSAKSQLRTRTLFADCLLNTFIRVLADRRQHQGSDLRSSENVIYLSDAVGFAAPFASKAVAALAERTIRDELVSPSFAVMQDESVAIGRCYLSLRPIESSQFWNLIGNRGSDWSKIAFQGLAIISPLEALEFWRARGYSKEILRVMKLIHKSMIKTHGISQIRSHLTQHFQAHPNSTLQTQAEQAFGLTPTPPKQQDELLSTNAKMFLSEAIEMQGRSGAVKLEKSIENATRHLAYVSRVFISPSAHFDAIERELRNGANGHIPGRNIVQISLSHTLAACFSIDPLFWLLTGKVYRFPKKCDIFSKWQIDIDEASAVAQAVDAGGYVNIGAEPLRADFLRLRLLKYYNDHSVFFYGSERPLSNDIHTLSPLLATLLIWPLTIGHSDELQEHIK